MNELNENFPLAESSRAKNAVSVMKNEE